MKEKLFLITALFVFNFSTAQVRVSIKGGADYSKLQMNDQTYWRIGYNLGGLVNISFSKKISIQNELHYSIKGYKTHPIQGFEQANVGLKYINMPVLFGFHSKKKLSYLIGPEFGYLLRATSRLSGEKIDCTEIFNRFDLGVDVAIAYKLFDKTAIELRYNHGFKTIMKQYHFIGDVVEETSVGKNRCAQLTFYYNLGK
jgi:hypothetical protein